MLRERKGVIYLSLRERRVTPVFIAKEFCNIYVMEDRGFGRVFSSLSIKEEKSRILPSFESRIKIGR